MAGHRKEIAADLALRPTSLSAENTSATSIRGRWNRRDFCATAATSALDRDNLAEEIESLGREQFNKLVSALRVRRCTW